MPTFYSLLIDVALNYTEYFEMESITCEGTYIIMYFSENAAHLHTLMKRL